MILLPCPFHFFVFDKRSRKHIIMKCLIIICWMTPNWGFLLFFIPSLFCREMALILWYDYFINATFFVLKNFNTRSCIFIKEKVVWHNLFYVTMNIVNCFQLPFSMICILRMKSSPCFDISISENIFCTITILKKENASQLSIFTLILFCH